MVNKKATTIIFFFTILLCANILTGQQYQWPTTNSSGNAPISGTFGEYRGPTNPHFHYGVDISVPINTVVRPAHLGTVARVVYNGNDYDYFIITNSDGRATLYQHVLGINTLTNGTVINNLNTSIALSGDLNNAAHIHFEIFWGNPWHDGRFVNNRYYDWYDPLDYLTPIPPDNSDPQFFKDPGDDKRELIIIPVNGGKVDEVSTNMNYDLTATGKTGYTSDIKLEGDVKFILHCFDRINRSTGHNSINRIVFNVVEKDTLIPVYDYEIDFENIYVEDRSKEEHIYNTCCGESSTSGNFYYKMFLDNDEDYFLNANSYTPEGVHEKGIWHTTPILNIDALYVFGLNIFVS